MRIVQPLLIGLILLFPAFSLAKPDKKGPEDVRPQERLTCMWRGVYHYPNDGQPPVRFDMVMIQDGPTIVGFMKEPNTFGTREEPFLHAVFKGKFDEKSGKITVTKKYDGTAGPAHDVEYEGNLSKDAAKVEGMWAIDEFKGVFTLDRVANTRSGAYSGVWTGNFEFKNEDRKPVSFNMLLIHDGQNLVGVMKEPNTLGKSEEPWLQSTLKGKVDDKTGKITLTKTYDGTAGENKEATFTGEISRDRSKLEGTWNLGKGTGRFTLQKQPLNEKTLEILK